MLMSVSFAGVDIPYVDHVRVFDTRPSAAGPVKVEQLWVVVDHEIGGALRHLENQVGQLVINQETQKCRGAMDEWVPTGQMTATWDKAVCTSVIRGSIRTRVWGTWYAFQTITL